MTVRLHSGKLLIFSANSHGPESARRGAAPEDRAYVASFPSMLGNLFAWLPVTVVLSPVAVPKMAMPPPSLCFSAPITPAWPAVTVPVLPSGLPVPPVPAVALPAKPAPRLHRRWPSST